MLGFKNTIKIFLDIVIYSLKKEQKVVFLSRGIFKNNKNRSRSVNPELMFFGMSGMYNLKRFLNSVIEFS